MANWYSPLKVAEDGKVRNGDVSSNVEQESQLVGLVALHGKED